MRLNFVFVLVLLLFAGRLVAQTDEQTLKLPPTLIKGKVVDQDDAAVDGAIVEVSLTTFDELRKEWGKLLNANVKTDDQGTFHLEIEKTPRENWNMYLDVTIGSKIHFVQHFRFFDDKLWQETVDLGSLSMSTGVRVTGQLVSPDAGDDLQGPVINVLAYMQDGSLFYRYLNCDTEGRFACVVPADCKLELSIGAENFACSKSVHKIEATEIGDGKQIPEFDLGKLRLKHGVSVVGSAKRIDGSPASGIVIGIIEGNDREGDDEAEHVSSAKTDAKGTFRLPPHLGKCTILALQGCRSRSVVNGESKMLFSDGDVPYFDPMDLDLEGKGPELTVEMIEVGSITIAGTIYDAKGKPLAGQPVIHSWVTRFGVLNQEQTKTDVDGKYSFAFGKGRKLSMRLYDNEIVNSGYDFFITKDAAFILEDLFPDRPSGLIDDLEFNAIEDDVDGLDWEVRRTGPRGGPSWLDRASEFASWLLFGE